MGKRATATPAPMPQAAKPQRPSFWARYQSRPWPYLLVFVFCFLFSTVIYGDVFRRAAEANFICSDDVQMKFLTDQSWGWLYCWSRRLLVAFKCLPVGALMLSLVMTAIVFMADRLLRLPHRWRGVTAVVPGLLYLWMLSLGLNLWYKDEPSLFILIPVLVALLLLVLTLICKFLPKRPAGAPIVGKPWGTLVAVAVFVAISLTARLGHENDILTSRMQVRALNADWEGIMNDAASASRPSRAVAAYNACALVQTNQLLERMFDIAYDYPEVSLRSHEGSEEYGLFLTDCNLYAGLTRVAYRCAMDHVVMNGPNVYMLKRMTLCALINGEDALAGKYLDILEGQTGEGDFVEKYRPYVGHRDVIEADPELSRIIAFKPDSPYYEQNYRSPAFLGYNLGLASGTDASLVTAIAACLYSKEVARCLPHIQFYAQRHGGQLPVCVQQAVAIIAMTRPEVAAAFGDVAQSQQSYLQSFFSVAKPIIEERKAAMEGKSGEALDRVKVEYNARLREALRDEWLGSYFYYYYCENNDPAQVTPAEKTGVN